jgi:hypothetical protein
VVGPIFCNPQSENNVQKHENLLQRSATHTSRYITTTYEGVWGTDRQAQERKVTIPLGLEGYTVIALFPGEKLQVQLSISVLESTQHSQRNLT